jgi:hypothetical protein
VKFRAQSDPADIGIIEYEHARPASAISLPSPGNPAFGKAPPPAYCRKYLRNARRRGCANG